MVFFRPISPPPLPFHLLEMTLVSAQDLLPTTLHLYAVAWADPAHKLTTRLSPVRGPDPSWNERFVFRVDNAFLLSHTSTITVHILGFHRRLRFLRHDPIVGTVRIVVSSLHPGSSTRFVALQVRRPTSLRPQGMLNLAFTLLDAALPLYYNIGGAPTAFKNKERFRLWGEREMGGSGMGEREVLELTLEKWRTDLSPEREGEEGAENMTWSEYEEEGEDWRRRRRKRKRSRALVCFCGEREEGAGAVVVPTMAVR